MCGVYFSGSECRAVDEKASYNLDIGPKQHKSTELNSKLNPEYVNYPYYSWTVDSPSLSKFNSPTLHSHSFAPYYEPHYFNFDPYNIGSRQYKSNAVQQQTPNNLRQFIRKYNGIKSSTVTLKPISIKTVRIIKSVGGDLKMETLVMTENPNQKTLLNSSVNKINQVLN